MSELIKLTEKEELARQRVCLALDNMDNNQAMNIIQELNHLVGMFKIGKELHSEIAWSGYPVLQEIYLRQFSKNTQFTKTNSGFIQEFLPADQELDSKLINYQGALPLGNMFLDLKFHDTKNTVGQSIARNVKAGVYMMNVHIASGEDACKYAIEQAYKATEIYNKHLRDGQTIERPKIIGVTVLSSLNDADLKQIGFDKSFDELVMLRTNLAKDWGLDGIVCPANKAGMIEKEFGSDLLYITPGIQWGELHGDNQKQLYTPDKAVEDCSNSKLVIGSAITKAKDKLKVAYEILQAMAKKL